MLNERNCPNCGAPIDVALNKCAYCGTSYFDISCIPLHEPFYLRLNCGTNEKPQIIMQKVYTTGVSITSEPDYITYRSMSGHIESLCCNVQRTYELTFVGLNER